VGTITSGTWSGTAIENNKLANSQITIAGTNVSLGGSISKETLRSNLDLTAALRFIGVTSTAMTDPYVGTPTLTSGATYIPAIGDVVIDSSSDAEYVCIDTTNSTYTWERLGRDGSLALDTAVIHNNLLASTGSMIYASAASTPAALIIGNPN
jgi:hypothetical protein